MSISDKVDFLEGLDIFSDLEDAELIDLARISEEFEFNENAVIAYQRDLADQFIIVREGRLFASKVDNRGIVRETKSYFPKDYLSDVWLFKPGTHDATVKGASDGRILCIDRSQFLELLDDNPFLIDFLRLSEEAAMVADSTLIEQPKQKSSELDLMQDERVHYMARRSIWILISQILGPIFLFLLWAFIALLSLDVSGGLALLAFGLPGISALSFTIWRTLDWANDYFIITDKQIIHHEYSLRGFRVRINKMPIDQVQSVEIEKPSLVANLLKIGTARITTAAQHSTMRFDNIDNPRHVLMVVNELREQNQAIGEGQTQIDMRTALEEQFQAEPALRPVQSFDDDDFLYEQLPSLSHQFTDGLKNLFRRFGRVARTRIEEGPVITYRKHPFTLLTRTWWLILISTLCFSFMISTEYPILRNALLIGWLLTLLWLTWRFLDWRNDVFQLTDQYIFDIDRLPFGFGESKKQAELANIQNVNAERPGFLATVLNFGNVYIETAGASADIVFERVANPTLVQNDVFRRRESLKQKQTDIERSQRRKEYAVMLDVYHQAQQAGRVPNRLPNEDLL